MSVLYILVAVVMVMAFAALVIRLVTDTVDDRRRANDPDAPTTWVAPDSSADAHHDGYSHHHGGDHGGGHHGGGDFGGGHHG